jgi:hypothetical protein
MRKPNISTFFVLMINEITKTSAAHAKKKIGRGICLRITRPKWAKRIWLIIKPTEIIATIQRYWDGTTNAAPRTTNAPAGLGSPLKTP